MTSLDVELYMLAVMVATGAVLGLCADVYRAVRGAWQLRGLPALVEDVAFTALAAAVLALGLVLGSWGSLRLAVFLGLALGVGLYAWLASPTVYGAVRAAAGRVRVLASRLRQGLRATGAAVGRLAGTLGRPLALLAAVPRRVAASLGGRLAAPWRRIRGQGPPEGAGPGPGGPSALPPAPPSPRGWFRRWARGRGAGPR